MNRFVLRVCRAVKRVTSPALRSLARHTLSFFNAIGLSCIESTGRPQHHIDELYRDLQGTNERGALSDRQRILEPLLDITLGELILPSQVLIDRSQIDLSDSESSIVLQTPNADIFVGHYAGRSLYFKRYRFTQDHRSGLTEAMVHEIIISCSLASPRIVPFMGVCRLGENLERVCLIQAPYHTITEFLLDQPDAARMPLLKDVADGLRYLHDSGVIYGGMSSAAVLVDDNGRACLSDFSLSRFEAHPMDRPDPAKPVPHLIWLAPECLGGLFNDESVALTRASDVYAFGCLAYLIFTGKDPFAEFMLNPGFPSRGALSVITAVCNDGARPTKPEVGDDAIVKHGLTDVIWGDILECCWERDPHSRPNVGELVERLSTYVAGADAS